jgi:hypothetical protein
VLADLTALLLAGHVAENPVKTQAVRDKVLKIHLRAIKALVPINENMIREQMPKAQADAKDRPN